MLAIVMQSFKLQRRSLGSHYTVYGVTSERFGRHYSFIRLASFVSFTSIHGEVGDREEDSRKKFDR